MMVVVVMMVMMLDEIVSHLSSCLRDPTWLCLELENVGHGGDGDDGSGGDDGDDVG